MNAFFATPIGRYLLSPGFLKLTHVFLLLLIGVPVVGLASYWTKRFAARRSSARMSLLLGRTILYFGLAVIALACLRELGIQISGVLGLYFTPDRVITLLRLIALLALGIPAVFFASNWSAAVASKRYSAQHGMIVGKVVLYSGLALIAICSLRELDFQISALLGAVGIVGVAVGFASQTSVSNIVSGLFLIGERPFVVNDVISVGETTGQVLSIDMLSVKLRTFDNRYVRIPNESLIKSQVINMSHFPIRRIDLPIAVASKENIGRVRQVLLDVGRRNPLCLEEPRPVVMFSGFGDSSVDLLFAVWAASEDYLNLKNTILEEIKEALEREGIEMPFPQRSLYTGAATQPFPVRIVRGD